MINVAHVTPSFYPAHVYGGTTESVFRLCRAVAREGIAVRVLTTDANGPNDVLDVDKINEVVLDDQVRARYCARQWPESMSISLLRELESFVRWADVVHLSAVYSFPTLPTLWMCRRLGKPLVWSPRGALQRWAGSRRVIGKRIWETLCRRLAPAQGLFHATSLEEAADSQARFPSFQAVVVPNGVDIAPIKRAARPDAFRLLFLGRLDPKKGLENLLAGCAGLNGKLKNSWHLTIAGGGDPGYEKKLRAEIGRLGLEGRVTLTGWVWGPEKDRLWENADVAVIPSFTENFCIVVAEALAHGLPVVASHGTPWQKVEEKGCGLWVDNSPESLRRAIETMSERPLDVMGDKGQAWMEQEFAWSQIGRQMAAVYTGLSGRGVPNR